MHKDLDLIGVTALSPAGSTNIMMILDRSGSMAGRESDVIGGFNSFVASCREADLANCFVTYVRFDTEVERVFAEELQDVPELNAALYTPRGNTALLDAVGQSVSAISDKADDRFIVITFTDGQENASREWTKEKVSRLISERESLGNWTFAFFGAEIDAWAGAGEMGYAPGNARSHARARTDDMMRATGRVAAVMSKKGIARSRYYADAVQSVADGPDVSDEEIARSLEGDAPGKAAQ